MTTDSDLEDSQPDEIRSPREVAVRALALFAPVGVALGAPRAEVVPWLKNEQLWEELTPLEVEFLSRENSPRQLMVNFSWQTERLVVLLWALGRIDELPPSSVQCDPQLFQELLPPYVTEPVANWIASATLRSDDELLQMADELLQQHWKARDAHLLRRPQPSEIDIEIVQERHHAINWIIGYDGLAWDDVTTDT